MFLQLRTQKPALLWAAALAGALLLVKFTAPLFLYNVPLGYDPGIYRYLFITYAEALKEFRLPELLPWAQEYPPAIYLVVAPFILMGVPVDVFIGWLWNVVPVTVALTLAVVTAKRTNAAVGILCLLVLFLSQPYYDGFYAMYMKVFVSLTFLVLTFHFVEKMSYFFPVTALLTVVFHQQTGLVLVTSLGVWWLLQIPKRWQETRFRTMTIVLATAGCLGVVYYLPQWQRAIWSPLKSIFILQGDDAPAGSFPDPEFYLRTMPGVLLLGLAGFILSFKKERGSLWQLAVIVPLLFVVFRLVFYRRFFMLLDFFLVPFAAQMLYVLWQALTGKKVMKAILIVLVVAQAAVSFQVWNIRGPAIRKIDISRIADAAEVIPKDASIMVMENYSGTWLRGWAPYHNVGAPGLFDYPGWSYEDWHHFINGSIPRRRKMLKSLEGQVYVLATPAFKGHYGDRVNKVLGDPCFEALGEAQSFRILRVICN